MDMFDQVRAMWARGSYAVVGDWFVDASVSCLDGLELRGASLLDVACGTGAVAIEAARRGADVTGVDLTPTMLEEAAARALAGGVDVSWRTGSFTDLAAFRGFDVVSSAFGVMFADDAAAVASEVLATLRPGGTAVLAAWRPDGAFGSLPAGLLDLVPELGQGPDRSVWASREGLEAVLAEAARRGPAARLVELREDVVGLPFPSVEAAVAAMLRWSGPWMTVFDALEALGAAPAGRAALAEHLHRYATPVEGGVRVDVTYRVARLHRPEPPDGDLAAVTHSRRAPRR